MRSFFRTLIICLAFVEGLNAAADPDVQFSFKEDGRAWKLVYDQQVNQQKIYEYIPSETDLDKWSDIVTVQYQQGEKVSPQEYYERFMNVLKKSAPTNRVESKVISKDDDKSIFWTWWIEDNSPLDQREWIRVFVDGDKTAFLRYTTKDVKNEEKYGPIWQKIIQSAVFAVPKAT